LGVGKTTPDELLFSLIEVNFREWSQIEKVRAEMKWKARLDRHEVGKLPKYQLKVKFKWLPKEFATYINVQNSLCEKCEPPRILRASHFLDHGIVVPDPWKLIEEIKYSMESTETGEGKKDRDESLRLSSEIIQIHMDKMRKFIDAKYK